MIDYWMIDYWMIDYWMIDYWMIDYWMIDYWMIDYLFYCGLHLVLQKYAWTPVFSERTCMMNPIKNTIVMLFLDLELVDCWPCLASC
jgi:hypothetical protein